MATIVMTGATGGIGSALATLLTARGDEVYAVGRDADRLAARGVIPIVADLSQPTSLATAVGPLERVDALVYCAGVVQLGNVADTPSEVWTQHLTVNLIAAAELTRLLLPALRASRGHVVYVNSGAGQRANPGWAAYAASKFGLRALADALRAEEAAHGVRVTTVYPGRTATAMQESVRAQEGGAYDPDDYIQPDTVARLIVTALDTPPDAHLTELTVRQPH